MVYVSIFCLKCFQILSVHSRLLIFQYLKHNPGITVSNLVKLVGLTQPTVSFHINKLLGAGIISKQKVGKKVFCKINKRCVDCTLFK